jgi:hypothetical protein
VTAEKPKGLSADKNAAVIVVVGVGTSMVEPGELFTRLSDRTG